MIGYLCAYLRYYHPFEFITAYLNCAANDEDIVNGTKLAEEYGIKISPPRFGISKDKFSFAKERGVIAKGLGSVKFMNDTVANELYDFSQKTNIKNPNIVDILLYMENETSINSRQINILIKIGFFTDFGNIREISQIYRIFSNTLASGSAKKIKKDGLTEEMFKIIERHSTDRNAKNELLKSFTIVDMYGLLVEVWDYIKQQGLPDIPFKIKAQNQLECLGYVDLTTNNEDDRRKLLILKIIPMKSKDSDKIWGYRVSARSVGSGKSSMLTIYPRLFEVDPVKAGDIIYVHDVVKNQRGFWYINKYRIIE